MLDKNNYQTCGIGLLAEETKRHYRVACQSTFVEQEQDCHETTENHQANDLWRIPGKGGSSKV